MTKEAHETIRTIWRGILILAMTMGITIAVRDCKMKSREFELKKMELEIKMFGVKKRIEEQS